MLLQDLYKTMYYFQIDVNQNVNLTILELLAIFKRPLAVLRLEN